MKEQILTPEQLSARIEAQRAILEPMGFKHISGQTWRYKWEEAGDLYLSGANSDFYALFAADFLFNEGMRIGREEKENEIKEALNI